MISLRYHMMTIAAIFVSLGLGIIVGGSIGQNWINEQQQTLLIGLEQKYDQAMQSNATLQNQIQELSGRMERANEEFSAFVTQGFATDLREQTIGLWTDATVRDDSLRVFLQSLGMNVVSVSDRPVSQPTYPLLLVGEGQPTWVEQWPLSLRLRVDRANLTPMEQGDLLQRIQHMYEEQSDEY